MYINYFPEKKMELNKLSINEQQSFIKSRPIGIFREIFKRNIQLANKLGDYNPNNAPDSIIMQTAISLLTKEKNAEFYKYCQKIIANFYEDISFLVERRNSQLNNKAETFRTILNEFVKSEYVPIYLKLFDIEEMDKTEAQKQKELITETINSILSEKKIENRMVALEQRQNILQSQIEENEKSMTFLKGNLDATKLIELENEIQSLIEENKELNKKIESLKDDLNTKKTRARTVTICTTEAKSHRLETEDHLNFAFINIAKDLVSPYLLPYFSSFIKNIIYTDYPILSDKQNGTILGSILASLYSDGKYRQIICDSNTTCQELIDEIDRINQAEKSNHIFVIHNIFGKINLSLLLNWYHNNNTQNIKLIFTIPNLKYLKYIPIEDFSDDFIFFNSNFISSEIKKSYHINFSKKPLEENIQIKAALKPFGIRGISKVYDASYVISTLYFSYIPLLSSYLSANPRDVLSKLSLPNNIKENLRGMLHD